MGGLGVTWKLEGERITSALASLYLGLPRSPELRKPWLPLPSYSDPVSSPRKLDQDTDTQPIFATSPRAHGRHPTQVPRPTRHPALGLLVQTVEQNITHPPTNLPHPHTHPHTHTHTRTHRHTHTHTHAQNPKRTRRHRHNEAHR